METGIATTGTTTVAARPNPRMRVASFTARQHAIGVAYVHKMRGTQEEALDILDTEPEDEVYRSVCRRFGFDPMDEASSS